MSDLTSLQQELAEQTRQLQAAQQLEQARIDTEQAQRRQIAATEARIAELRIQEHAAQLQAAQRNQAGYIQRSDAANARLLAAIDQLIGGEASLAAVATAWNDADTAWEAAQLHADAALSAVEQDAYAQGTEQARQEAQRSGLTLSADRIADRADQIARQAVGKAAAAFDRGESPWAVILQHVARLPDAAMMRFWMGLFYWRTGQLSMPSPNFNARQATAEVVRAAGRRWHPLG